MQFSEATSKKVPHFHKLRTTFQVNPHCLPNRRWSFQSWRQGDSHESTNGLFWGLLQGPAVSFRVKFMKGFTLFFQGHELVFFSFFVNFSFQGTQNANKRRIEYFKPKYADRLSEKNTLKDLLPIWRGNFQRFLCFCSCNAPRNWIGSIRCQGSKLW